METIKKIVVIGPESTGKSTLCEKLAGHYKTLWVPEYAREYLEKNGADYMYDDLLTIAEGQIELEHRQCLRLEAEGRRQKAEDEKQKAEDRLLNSIFIDTDMYVMKVWSEYVFNQCNNWILNRIAERRYDLYLLCDVDLPWVKDDLREYPDQKIRKKLFHFYKDAMVNQSTPWRVISGNYEQRFQRAVEFIEESFTKKNVQK
jgi:NadR type nicotinamide-nucleotide adenylyltransferase